MQSTNTEHVHRVLLAFIFQPYRRSSILAITIIVVFGIAINVPGCRRMSSNNYSDKARQLFSIIDNQQLPLKERGDAVRALGQLKERETVPRLALLLRNAHNDVLTLEVIEALRTIGGRNALLELRQFKKNCTIQLHGKIRSSLDAAIESLENDEEKW